MIRVVVFDAYGTLFDVYSVAELAERLFPGQGAALSVIWRDKQVEYSRLISLSDPRAQGSQHYQDFWTLTQLALDFARAPRASLHMSTGVNMGRQGTLAFWLGQMLVLLTGNLDVPGGNVLSVGYYARHARAGRTPSALPAPTSNTRSAPTPETSGSIRVSPTAPVTSPRLMSRPTRPREARSSSAASHGSAWS